MARAKISTFREKDESWQNYNPMKRATIDVFYENSKLM